MKDPGLYLGHIFEFIERIERYTAAGKSAFLDDSLTQDGVLRNFETLGEAVKQLPDEIRKEAPTSPGERSLVCATC